MIVAIAGHQPTELWGPKPDRRYSLLRQELGRQIAQLVRDRKAQRLFLGTSLGVDSMAFDLCVRINDEHPGEDRRGILTLIAVVAYQGQADRWAVEQQERHRMRLQRATEIHYVESRPGYEVPDAPVGAYHPAKLLARNQYLVDHAELLLVVWGGNERGTTADLVGRARNAGKELVILNPFELCGR